MTHDESYSDWRKHEAEGMSWAEWVKTPAGRVYVTDGREQPETGAPSGALVPVVLAVLECDNCAEHAPCVLLGYDVCVCVPCLRAQFDYALEHCGPELAEDPTEWADVFRRIGEPLPEKLAEMVRAHAESESLSGSSYDDCDGGRA